MASARSDQEVVDGWAHGVSGTVVRADRLVHVEHVWSTAVTINLPGIGGRESDARAVIDQCAELFAKVDEVFSTFRPLSEVALHRAGLEGPGRHSDEFEDVRRACAELRRTTHGAFDPWAVPGGYDPSGYVKGWAAGVASHRLIEAGFGHHLINAGGDVFARGDERPGTGRGWPVGILSPHSPGKIVEVVGLRDEAMATSGRYERGDHVIDPATGDPATGADSATVVGPDPGVADALASAALVRGLGSVEWFGALGPAWSLHIVIADTAHTYGSAFEQRPTRG